MASFSIATINLYNYVAPSYYWYQAGAENTNELKKHWEPKQAFISGLLGQLSADVVGFQEVFSVEDLKALVNSAGYPYFGTVEGPKISTTNPNVFIAPVVAIASRFPITSIRPAPSNPSVELDGLLDESADYRRFVIEAEISVPNLAKPLVVFVAHLKSQSASFDEAEIKMLPAWPDRITAFIRLRAKAIANQMIRRSAEAIMLREHIITRCLAAPDQAIALIGDLNEEPGRVMEMVFTQRENIGTIVGQKYDDLNDLDKAHRFNSMLFDTRYLAGLQTGNYPSTHKGGKFPSSTLDYILVSNSLNNNNPSRVASAAKVRVIDDHFLDKVDLRTASDHAAVYTKFEIAALKPFP